MRNKILRSANAKYHYSYLFFYKINKGDLPLIYSCVFWCEFIDLVGFFSCYCLTRGKKMYGPHAIHFLVGDTEFACSEAQFCIGLRRILLKLRSFTTFSMGNRSVVVFSWIKLQFCMTSAKRVSLQQECQGCQPPTSTNDKWRHNAHGTWRHL